MERRPPAQRRLCPHQEKTRVVFLTSEYLHAVGDFPTVNQADRQPCLHTRLDCLIGVAFEDDPRAADRRLERFIHGLVIRTLHGVFCLSRWTENG